MPRDNADINIVSYRPRERQNDIPKFFLDYSYLNKS